MRIRGPWIACELAVRSQVSSLVFFFFQAEDGIRDVAVTGVQTCALPICFGRRQISKTSCSISGPTLTTIARIPRGKGKRRIRPCQDQSPISARFSGNHTRSEEHTSELQSRLHLVCRLLLEKKKLT